MNRNLSFCYPSSIPFDEEQADYKASLVSSKLAKVCCNDDQIIKIIFALGEKTGCITDDSSINPNSNYPNEVNYVLSQLQRKFPAFGGFSDDESAFQFIRSRYAQSAGELNSFVNNLVSYINQHVGNNLSTDNA